MSGRIETGNWKARDRCKETGEEVWGVNERMGTGGTRCKKAGEKVAGRKFTRG